MYKTTVNKFIKLFKILILKIKQILYLKQKKAE